MPQPQPEDGRLIGADWISRDGDHVSLTVTRCRTCASTWFPPRDVCSTCASTDVHHQPSGEQGAVYASTVVRVGPPTYRPPYVLSYVDIGGVRLLAHARSDQALAPGSPVRLTIDQIGADDSGPLSSYVVTAVPREENQQ